MKAGQIFGVLLLLSGCVAPVRYDCPQRLTEQWQFSYCMTGPYPWLVEATAEWCRWCCSEPVDVDDIAARLARMTLPAPCRVFDMDSDNDVDLEDYKGWMNGDRS